MARVTCCRRHRFTFFSLSLQHPTKVPSRFDALSRLVINCVIHSICHICHSICACDVLRRPDGLLRARPLTGKTFNWKFLGAAFIHWAGRLAADFGARGMCWTTLQTESRQIRWSDNGRSVRARRPFVAWYSDDAQSAERQLVDSDCKSTASWPVYQLSMIFVRNTSL